MTISVNGTPSASDDRCEGSVCVLGPGPYLEVTVAPGAEAIEMAGAQLSRHDRDAVEPAIDEVRTAGAANVVVSRTTAPSIAVIDDDVLEVRGPDVHPVDSHGGGDSMTGALATAQRGRRLGLVAD